MAPTSLRVKIKVLNVASKLPCSHLLWWEKQLFFLSCCPENLWYDNPAHKVVKNLPANARDIRDVGCIPGSGRSPGGGHGNPPHGILAWRISWTEDSGGQWSIGLQRTGHDWSDVAHTQPYSHPEPGHLDKGLNLGCPPPVPILMFLRASSNHRVSNQCWLPCSLSLCLVIWDRGPPCSPPCIAPPCFWDVWKKSYDSASSVGVYWNWIFHQNNPVGFT